MKLFYPLVEGDIEMDNLLKQRLQQAISHMWVQRSLGKITDNDFKWYLQGANSALKNFELHFSVEERGIVDGVTAASNVTTDEPNEVAYFQKGYLKMVEIAEEAGVDLPALPSEFSLKA